MAPGGARQFVQSRWDSIVLSSRSTRGSYWDMGTRSSAVDILALQDSGIGDVVRRGAVYGVEAWAAYAVAEALFSSVLPWALPLVGDYYVTSDAFTVFVTALYLAFGALSGAAAGLLLRAAGRALPRLGRLPPAK